MWNNGALVLRFQEVIKITPHMPVTSQGMSAEILVLNGECLCAHEEQGRRLTPFLLMVYGDSPIPVESFDRSNGRFLQGKR